MKVRKMHQVRCGTCELVFDIGVIPPVSSKHVTDKALALVNRTICPVCLSDEPNLEHVSPRALTRNELEAVARLEAAA